MKPRVIQLAVATVMLAAIWYVVLFLPLQREHQAIGAQIAEAEAQMADFNGTISQLPSYLETRDELHKRMADMNSKLYAKQDVLKLLDRLKQDAADYRLRVVEVIPPVSELLQLSRTLPVAGEPQFLNVTLKLTGSYVSFGEFTGALEHEEFFRGVTACHIGTPDVNLPVQYAVTFRALLGIGTGRS
ncbi:MAG: hypothetical protein AB1644_01725 [Candidatus Zixiibacteriota bacterium]